MRKKGKKKGTPAWVERLLNLRTEISEDEYREAWKKINRLKRGSADWEAEGRKIVDDLRREQKESKAVFSTRDFRTVSAARKAAEIHQADFGGRIVRRDAKGRFSKRGMTFQVIP